MVNDLASFYCPAERKFYSIVSLGLNTCGFRRITHGGMTAAIMDETLGGLFLALRQAGALTFWGPAFTAALEVSYKAVRIPSLLFILSEISADHARADHDRTFQLLNSNAIRSGPKVMVPRYPFTHKH